MRFKNGGISFLCAVILALTGCAGDVARSDSAKPFKYEGQKFGKVTVTVNWAVQEKLNETLKFDVQQFTSTVQSTLAGRNLIDENASDTVDIEITGLRIRSTFTAATFGFLGGNDSLQGTVALRHDTGAVIHKFDVSAAWAHGGTASGQERVGRLMEEFARLTAQQILGESGEKAGK